MSSAIHVAKYKLQLNMQEGSIRTKDSVEMSSPLLGVPELCEADRSDTTLQCAAGGLQSH